MWICQVLSLLPWFRKNRPHYFQRTNSISQNEKIYLQVVDDISNEKTFAREVDSLLKIKDAYPKLLIARTRHEPYQFEGIQVIGIADWLKQ